MYSKRNITIVAVVAVIIIIAVLMFSGNSGSLTGPLGNLGSDLSGSGHLSSELNSPSNQTLGAVAQIATQQINSISQFQVLYTGQADLDVGYVLQVPMNMLYEKLGNNSRVSMNLTNIPLFGNVSSTNIQLSNGTDYYCSSANLLPYSQDHQYNLSNSSILCIMSNSIRIGFLSQLQNTTTSIESGTNQSNSKVNVIGTRQYRGQGCVLITIEGNATYNNTDVYNPVSYSINYNGTACLSSRYNIPLNVSVHVVYAINTTEINRTYNLQLNLNESSINNPVSLSQIDLLPGPVVTSNSLGLHSYSNSVPTQNKTSFNYRNGQAQCFPVNAQFNCAPNSIDNGKHIDIYNNQFQGYMNGTFANLYISQSTGLDLREASIVFVPQGTQLNSSGIPQVSFTANGTAYLYDFPNSSKYVYTNIDDVPISQQVSGTFNGTLWIRYWIMNTTTNMWSGWKYVKIATLTVTSIAKYH